MICFGVHIGDLALCVHPSVSSSCEVAAALFTTEPLPGGFEFALNRPPFCLKLRAYEGCAVVFKLQDEVARPGPGMLLVAGRHVLVPLHEFQNDHFGRITLARTDLG
ncbi:MAG: hypothetical protein NVS2B7_00150 [Herpetosiphon sp.]